MANPPYPYGGSSYRNAMLGQLQGGDPYGNDPYVPQLAQQAQVGAGRGAAITDAVGGLAPTIASQVAGRTAAQSGFGALAGAAGDTGLTATAGALRPVLGGAAAAGLGIGTELVGAALKPKQQQATPSPFADLTDQYGRREEGSGEGIAGGAVKWGGRGAQVGNYFGPIGLGVGAGIGALGGAIGGALSKNAASAYSDFSRADAVNAIRQMYQTRGGREPTPAELNQILQGAGTKPGDKWVGEKGLYSVLQSLDQNFAQERTQDPTAHAAQAYARAQGLPSPMVPPAGQVAPTGTPGPAAAPVDDRVMTPEDRAGMNQNPQRVDATYGGGANTTLTPDGGTDYGGAGGRVNAPREVPPAGATAPPAGAAATAPATTAPPDSSQWDTDNFAAPAHVATKPSAQPPPGWDATKWNNPNHQTPKYAVGRILSQHAFDDAGFAAATAEIQRAYPGTRVIGNDKVDIPGVGVVDIRKGADAGGQGWQWGQGGDTDGTGTRADKRKSSGGAAASSMAGGYNSGGNVADPGTIAEIIKRIQGISGGTPSVTSARDAVLNQF